MSVLVDSYNYSNVSIVNDINIIKEKCNVKGCKEVIDLVNRHQCQKCKKIHCLFHRIYESHNCEVFLKESKKDIFKDIKKKFQLQNKLLNDLKKEFIK